MCDEEWKQVRENEANDDAGDNRRRPEHPRNGRVLGLNGSENYGIKEKTFYILTFLIDKFGWGL